VKITADTNLLVRAMTGDVPRQSRLARNALAEAALVAVPLAVLCELVWVLTRGYKIPLSDIALAIRRLAAAENVALNRPAVTAGLAMLEAGGDFADGVIAYEGQWLGAETFMSFDRRAVELLAAQGRAAQLLE
jgi:predicted nucleic-acid-binding protein